MKKILILGMVDSVHTARWIERIVDLNCEIHVFPSRVHRRIHPEIFKLTNENSNVKLLQRHARQRWAPYLDYMRRNVRFGSGSLLNSTLKKIINRNNYSHIHALEIQHAGYLLLDVVSAVPSTTKIICTNWGSDIYYFRQFKEDLARISELLAVADSYSAECMRDYELARELGFKGEELPLIPNSFRLNENFLYTDDTSSRYQVIAKCYGEVFGLGKILIEVMSKFLGSNESASVLLYSVTDDLLLDARALQQKFPSRVKISTVRNPLTPDRIAKEYQRSRVYLGASRSDGISTSFLEAMNYGAFPIQTNTSCAQDWLAEGCLGLAVPADADAILTALNNSYEDLDLICRAASINIKVLKRITNNERLKLVSQSFYGR